MRSCLLVSLLFLSTSMSHPAPGISTNQSKTIAAPARLADWSARAVEQFGCRKVAWKPGEVTPTNGVLTIVNQGAVRKHVFFSATVLTGDFSITTEAKGGNFLGFVRADSKQGFLGLQIPGNVMRTFVITRTGSEISFTVDGYLRPHMKYDADETTDFLFGIILNKGKACEIKSFSLNTGPEIKAESETSAARPSRSSSSIGNKSVLKK